LVSCLSLLLSFTIILSFTNILLGIPTGHIVEEEVLSLRRQPSKTSSQAVITRKLFKAKVRKELPIPTFINDYNHSMGQVDVANQLRASYTVYFQRNLKEFFPGIFWLINMVNANY
jgi:hypothetical protein